MSEDEFISKLAKKYKEVMDKRRDKDYELNESNWLKFLSVVEYFKDMAKKQCCKMDAVTVIPNEQHGSVSVTLDLFDVYKDEVKAFADIISLVDVFEIYPLINDEISLCVQVNNIYENK